MKPRTIGKVCGGVSPSPRGIGLRWVVWLGWEMGGGGQFLSLREAYIISNLSLLRSLERLEKFMLVVVVVGVQSHFNV